MKKFVQLSLGILLVFVLSSCALHEHAWCAPTCTEPQTCIECGETEGEARGHVWKSADCETPKTCKECGETEGKPLGHKWDKATCTTPKKCSVCGETEGKPLAHTWAEATCTQPKTCKVCKETDGDPLGHDSSGQKCDADMACPRCGEIIPAPGHKFSEATCTEASVCSVCGAKGQAALGHTVTSGVCERCSTELYEPISGSGDDVVSGITIGNGLYRIHFVNDGSRNFIVKSYDADNDWDLLVNQIGSYNGYVFLAGESTYSFEIQSSGNWTFTIEPLTKTEETSFAGTGDFVTNMFQASSGAWKFTHDGSRNFIVKAYTSDGYDLLINEIGTYDGKTMVSVPYGSRVVFEIRADGNWTAAPVQ